MSTRTVFIVCTGDAYGGCNKKVFSSWQKAVDYSNELFSTSKVATAIESADHDAHTDPPVPTGFFPVSD
jgi:hypothetical protein